jgi:TatD DNase family protein
MGLVDSHCHLDMLDLAKYDGDLDLAVDAAMANGVSHLLTVSTQLETFDALLGFCDRYDHVACSFGVHPNEAEGELIDEALIVDKGRDDRVVAIGETGLDYYRGSDEVKPYQQDNFRSHIRAAIALNKPLIVHTREAQIDTIKLMQAEHAGQCGGVMHCFTESWEMAKQALDLGFYISLSGIVTFKNATQVHELAKKVPMDRLLVETDAPFLAPMPYRGKTNEPAYVKHVAEHIAILREMEFGAVCEQTTNNFFKLFKGVKR